MRGRDIRRPRLYRNVRVGASVGDLGKRRRVDEASEPVMHIGELAERTALSLRTIRHYDEIGLLVPSGRSVGGFRQYTQGDLERLLLIRRMKPLGFSLEQMSDLLDAIARHRDDPTSLENAARLDDYVGQALDRRAELSRQVAMADEFLELLTKARS